MSEITRERIEELLVDVELQMKMAPHLATQVADQELAPILRLALAAVPKIEWVEVIDEDYRWESRSTLYSMAVAWLGDNYLWVVNTANHRDTGAAPTLAAAQAAAEAALMKLVRGE